MKMKIVEGYLQLSILLATVLVTTCASINDVPPEMHQVSLKEMDSDIQPRRSYMTVRVVSTTGGEMCVECWSGDHNKDRKGCSSSASEIRVLSWDFNSGASTKFWCDATWGKKYLSRFAVFGDGVPKKSSEWRVDNQGKKRTHENGNVVNDYFRSWS